MEFERILKRILDKRKYELITYWDYNDSLTEEQVLKIILEEDGLSDIEYLLYDCNLNYREDIIKGILEEELSEKEKEDKDLFEDLIIELGGYFDSNLKDILKNSSARLRITLLDDKDYIYIPEFKKSQAYKYVRKRFKGYFKVKDLETEIKNNMGSDYGHFVFYGDIKGLRILELREEILKGEITLNKNLNFGIFNSYAGCGGMMDLKLKKPITLLVDDWRYTKEEKLIKNIEQGNKKSYYSVKIELDSNGYGVQETYGLTSECWAEI